MFGSVAVLLADFILGVPPASEPQSQFKYTRRTAENVQFVQEFARRIAKEQADVTLCVPILKTSY